MIILFYILSQRYEAYVGDFRYRFNHVVLAQIENEKCRNKALEKIPLIQKMYCPVKPDIFRFNSVFTSVFDKTSRYNDGINLTKEIVEIWNQELDSLDLHDADLSGALDLRNAHLFHTNLHGANLHGADLTFANLYGADLVTAILCSTNFSHAYLKKSRLNVANLTNAYLGRADLCDCNLTGANLKGAILRHADLSHACLWGTDLSGAVVFGANFNDADLSLANLENAVGATVEQLSQARTLFNAHLDSSLLVQLEKDFPELFINLDPYPD